MTTSPDTRPVRVMGHRARRRCRAAPAATTMPASAGRRRVPQGLRGPVGLRKMRTPTMELPAQTATREVARLEMALLRMTTREMMHLMTRLEAMRPRTVRPKPMSPGTMGPETMGPDPVIATTRIRMSIVTSLMTPAGTMVPGAVATLTTATLTMMTMTTRIAHTVSATGKRMVLTAITIPTTTVRSGNITVKMRTKTTRTDVPV
jgi:hypothetical protein